MGHWEDVHRLRCKHEDILSLTITLCLFARLNKLMDVPLATLQSILRRMKFNESHSKMNMKNPISSIYLNPSFIWHQKGIYLSQELICITEESVLLGKHIAAKDGCSWYLKGGKQVSKTVSWLDYTDLWDAESRLALLGFIIVYLCRSTSNSLESQLPSHSPP